MATHRYVLPAFSCQQNNIVRSTLLLSLWSMDAEQYGMMRQRLGLHQGTMLTFKAGSERVRLLAILYWKRMGVCMLQAKRKYLEILQEKQNLEADRAELQQKYAQKAQQARKLQDMFSKASSQVSCVLIQHTKHDPVI